MSQVLENCSQYKFDDSMSGLAVTLKQVVARIAASRENHKVSQPVRLVAVSKTKPLSAVIEAFNAGQRHFGENYVQELFDKSHMPEAPVGVRWHFIGHLQTNKVKKLLDTKSLWMVETVDSEKLARALNAQWAKVQMSNPAPEPLRIMVQVNTSGENSKSGVQPQNCTSLVKTIVAELHHLKFCGLMTIGRLEGDPVPDFATLASLRKDVATQLDLDEASIELSMGMSGDFDQAISLGSTNVRVGSTIFGDRHYPSQDKSEPAGST